MKAKLLKSLRINGKAVRPTKVRVTLVDLDDKEFTRLEALGVVAKPSSDDRKLAASDADEGAAAAEKAAAEKAAADKAAAEKAAAAKKTETKGGTGKKPDDDL